MVPLSVSVPAPIFVSAPLVVALAPEIVRVVPASWTSMELVVAAVSVNARFVLAVLPVYCRVPPPKTRLEAAAVAWPRDVEAAAASLDPLPGLNEVDGGT